MVVEPQETTEPPTTIKLSKWEKIKKALIFWTTLISNLITIIFFLYKWWKNGS